MLETQENLVLCGVVNIEGVNNEIYARPETGDILYDDPVSGSVMLITPLTETDPMAMDSVSSLEDAISNGTYGPIIGIILTERDAIVIKTYELAERRPYADLFTESNQEIEIDLNMVDPIFDEE